jgi:hypothetical protein
MYILTIVFVASQISVVSTHNSKDACEDAARRALTFSAGSQAVASARCEAQAESAPK